MRAAVTAAVLLASLLASLLAAGVPERVAPDEGRLWRVSRPGVPDSYVLGTIHVADRRVARIAPQVAADSPGPGCWRSRPCRCRCPRTRWTSSKRWKAMAGSSR